jgi:ribosomal protein S18 acetylase RimI-like enzyme
VPVAAKELYIAAFTARCDALQTPGRPKVEELGVRGLLAGSDDPRIRLLVTDDRAGDVLPALVRDVRAGMVSVFAPAKRCARFVAGHLGWTSDVVTAMVCHDLEMVPAPILPSELTVRPVERLVDDDPGGVALHLAVAVAKRASSAVEDPPEVFAEYLRSLPANFRLFAAVDRRGSVRATSGFGVFGEYANVIFVNTEPSWRGRGIGQAMTGHALRAARHAGARQACLDASAAGQSIYRRLGFETAGTLRRFLSPG